MCEEEVLQQKHRAEGRWWIIHREEVGTPELLAAFPPALQSPSQEHQIFIELSYEHWFSTEHHSTLILPGKAASQALPLLLQGLVSGSS